MLKVNRVVIWLVAKASVFVLTLKIALSPWCASWASLFWLTGPLAGSPRFARITICCGHLSQSIVDYFGDGSKFNAEINYLVEDKQLGRGGALRNALESMPDNDLPVIAMNGDIITNLSLNELLQHHTDSDALATLVSVPLISPYGIVQFDERGMVSGFQEKPELPFWINAGIYVLDPKLVKRFTEKW